MKDDYTHTALGDLVRSVRRERGLTLRALGKLMGVSAAYISDIERGNRRPTSDAVLQLLAPALDIDPDIVWFTAGRIPPDLRDRTTDRDVVRQAFAAMRTVLCP